MFLQKIMEMINFTYTHTLISFSLLRVRRLFEKALISTMGKTLRGIYRESWSYFCFSSDMVLIFLVSSAVIKVGRLFVKTQISTAALIKLFSVKGAGLIRAATLIRVARLIDQLRYIL